MKTFLGFFQPSEFFRLQLRYPLPSGAASFLANGRAGFVLYIPLHIFEIFIVDLLFVPFVLDPYDHLTPFLHRFTVGIPV